MSKVKIARFIIFFFSFLGKRGVKEEIINFNPRTIVPDNRESVEKLLKKNADSFDPEVGKQYILLKIYENKISQSLSRNNIFQVD